MFWRGVFGYLPVNVVQGLVGLLTIVLFTRVLTPGQFGDYALGLSVMTLAHTAIFTWNEAAVGRFWAGESHRNGGADHAATVHRAWLGLLAVIPLAVLAAALWPMSPSLKLAVIAGLLALIPRTFAKLGQERRRAAGEVGGSAKLELIQTLGGFGFGAALAYAGLGGAAPLIGFGLASLIAVAVCARHELAKAQGGRYEPARLREHVAYGLPLAASLLLTVVLSTTDRFLLAAFLDGEAVAVYHAGYSLSNRTLDVAFIWLGAAGAPAMVMALERGGREALANAAGEQFSVMLLLTLPAAVGLALVARPLAELMIGPAMAAGAAQVTPLIALGGLLAGLNTYYFSEAFVLGRRSGLALWAMLAPALANLGLNLLLIPRLGIEGALWSTVISYALGVVVAIAMARKVMPLPLPWRVIGEALAAAAVMALAVSAIPELGGFPELALKAAAGGATYGVIIFLLDTGQLRSRAQSFLRARSAA
ncbi:lipopolysaccharide biosynthesis protein [Phenylobacterium sp.]|uniref:lipopolysaccharide biosynthesis protein n=1 Tax=Phenylobacterium sp. TaxID=1871053 RepID=UPI002736A57A|nr:lipopolysaccharide biosynthesis protein [Phenylobacterium sp.]MDP3853924.1 lipopolysaccharide biosynthesis protein [Phenylobacterium sp.]